MFFHQLFVILQDFAEDFLVAAAVSGGCFKVGAFALHFHVIVVGGAVEFSVFESFEHAAVGFGGVCAIRKAALCAKVEESLLMKGG